ncbi:hypothetical protein G5I_09842 [Acromyrmex echinatior]|uniref:Uncharacterized protein n=1 Tax=Acromyrmex echinatior TaxID=103372 RepID=F4WV51_ACREC|nr:hypothetical protein G5I_09842 [Acromyrmex echinatior]
MSGVGFLATVKTFAPGGRRRRRCEKQQKVLELPPGYGMQPDVVPSWDTAPPITPPAAFLPPGYKKGFPVFKIGINIIKLLVNLICDITLALFTIARLKKLSARSLQNWILRFAIKLQFTLHNDITAEMRQAIRRNDSSPHQQVTHRFASQPFDEIGTADDYRSRWWTESNDDVDS